MLELTTKKTLTVGQIIKVMEFYDKDTEVKIQRTDEKGRIIQMSNTHAQIMDETVNEQELDGKAVTIWLHDDRHARHEEEDFRQSDLNEKLMPFSIKEMKDLVNKWIIYHAEHDADLTHERFDRLLGAWQTTYNRLCGTGDSYKMINSVNLKVNISTPEDVERLRKLCEELSETLNNEQAEQ